MAQLSLFSKY